MNVTKLNDRDPDRGQRDAALLSLAITLVLAAVLYVALFDVETALEHVVLAVVVVIALAAAAFVHVSATPTRRLPDPEKVRRRAAARRDAHRRARRRPAPAYTARSI